MIDFSRRVKSRLQVENLVKSLLQALEAAPDGLDVRIRELQAVRTLEQNRFMWRRAYQPIAEQMSEATGRLVKKEDLHHFFKDLFGTREIVRHPLTGEQISVPKSTTKYKKAEMSAYLEQVFAWGAERGVWFE